MGVGDFVGGAVGGTSSNPLIEALVAQGLSQEEAEAFAAAAQANQSATGYQAVQQELFPGGTPWATVSPSATSSPTSLFGSTIAGVGGLVSAGLSGEGVAPSGPLGGILGGGIGAVQGALEGIDTETPGVYVDPVTGAIAYEEGVSVDPNADPTSGVIFDPNKKAPGSYRWLREASKKWSEEKVNKWRDKLRGLGYEIAEKGPFDITFRTALELYHRNKWFYGEELPVDQTVGTERVRDIADPIMVEQDIQTAFVSATGEEAPDHILAPFKEEWMRSIRRALAHGATPEHAALKGQKAFAESFTEDPIIQEFGRRKEHGEMSTRIADSLMGLSQLGGGLGL